MDERYASGEQAGLDPARLRRAAEAVIGAGHNAAAPAPDRAGEKAEADRRLSAQLRKDMADPSTWWRAYNTAPIGRVSPATIRDTKPDVPVNESNRDYRSIGVGGPKGEQLAVPGAVLTKAGTVVAPRTPEIRQGLAQGEGMLLRFRRGPTTPDARVVYFVDEAARRATLVHLLNDGGTKTLTITDKELLPKRFTIGAAGQVSEMVSKSLNGARLENIELMPGVGQRLGMIDAQGIPTTVEENDRSKIQFERVANPIDQAKLALQAQATFAALPTTPQG